MKSRMRALLPFIVMRHRVDQTSARSPFGQRYFRRQGMLVSRLTLVPITTGLPVESNTRRTSSVKLSRV